MSPAEKFVVGIDLGGTAINYTFLDERGQFLIDGLHEHPSRSVEGPAVCLGQIADGLAYAWRVEAGIASPTVSPSKYAAAPPAVDGLERGLVPGRLLRLPQPPVRDLQGAGVEDLSRNLGHGWGHDPLADPALTIPREAAAVLTGPLRRNAGGATGWPQAGGRAKVPPMPWSLLTHGLSPDPLDGPPELAADAAVLSRALELLAVRWVVSTSRDWPIEAARRLPVSLGVPYRVELQDPRPPALLFGGARVEPDEAAALEELLHGTSDLRSQVLVDAPVPGLAAQEPANALPAEVLAWAPGRWTVALPEHRGGLLVVTERFHPGWSARDEEGRPLPSLRANLLHEGVLVGPSVRRVELRFRPPGARLGAALGSLGLLALGLCFGAARRLARRAAA